MHSKHTSHLRHRTLIARGACKSPLIFLYKMIMLKITIKIRESTVVPFIKIKSNILVSPFSIQNNKKKQKTTTFFFFLQQMEGKEVKWDKKELDIEVDCREKANYFLITLTCKCARIDFRSKKKKRPHICNLVCHLFNDFLSSFLYCFQFK